MVDTAESALTRVGDTLMVRVEWSGEAVALLARPCNDSPSIRFVAVWRRDLVMLPSGGQMSESSENKEFVVLSRPRCFRHFVSWGVQCFHGVLMRRPLICLPRSSLCAGRIGFAPPYYVLYYWQNLSDIVRKASIY